MSNALVVASTGLRNAEQAFTRAASQTLRATFPMTAQPSPALTIDPPPDLASSIAAQMEAGVAFKANLAVYRVANDMYRSLLRATAS